MLPLPVQTYNYPNGKPLSLGYLLVALNTDGANGAVQVCAGVEVKVQLDSLGNVTGNPQFWPNFILSPPNSIYIVRSYSENGELVSTVFQTI
jgi:hypothetical protein